MTDIRDEERSVSKGLTPDAAIHMTGTNQIKVGGRWKVEDAFDEVIDRDTFEKRVGDGTVRWFNGAFGARTFTRRYGTDEAGRRTIHAVNTSPTKESRTVEDYVIIRE